LGKTVEKVAAWARLVRDSVERVFYGKSEVVDRLLVTLLCRGHALIEDVPGVGKTILSRALARSLGGEFKRIQCTPDLLPADVLGVSVYSPKTGEFEFKPGPILTNLLLVDEVNRATPRTQSALLEAMGEAQISVDGRMMPLPDPFFMMATENPVEFEGTFPLPEAQKDRFFMTVQVGYPPREAELAMLESQRRLTHPVVDLEAVTDLPTVRAMQQAVLEVHVAPALHAYLLDLVDQSRQDPRLALGVSPRGSLALFRGSQALAALDGRSYVVPEDIKALALPVFKKRLILKPEQVMRGVTEEQVIRDVLDRVEVPLIKAEE
jgi:MoxR-like ATPase